jgi:hypothetical protein
MPRLLDPISDDQRRLLRLIADGWRAGGGQWPVWQYVSLRMNADGFNAEQILLGLPRWQHGYQSVITPRGGIAPAPHEPIGLTIHGIVKADHPATTPLMLAFLKVLAAAEERQRAAVPDPRSTVEVRCSIEELLHARYRGLARQRFLR